MADETENQDQVKAVQQGDAELEIKRATRHAEQRGDKANFDWMLSNRVDNRVVIHERDEAHPGGECFIGGDGPDYCAHTPEIDRLIRTGQIIVVPEPKEGRAKPIIVPIAGQSASEADSPGEPIRLGRVVNPDLFEAEQVKEIQKVQDRQPEEIPVPAEVQKPADPPEAKQSRNTQK